MPTYVTLASWTDQGIKNVKESPSRLDAFRAAAEKLGCKIMDFYMVTGRYDMVLITEAPNEEAVAMLALATGSKGTVRTETLRAYPEAAYREIISKLP